MTLPVLPELPNYLSMPSIKQHLMAVRQSLEKACLEIDEQIRSLDLCQMSPQVGVRDSAGTASQRLFEISPSVYEQEDEELVSKAGDQPETRMVMSATAPSALDPQLEQATLEELNSALSKAFVQMAGRARW